MTRLGKGGRPRVGSTFIKDNVRQLAVTTDRPGATRPRWVRPCPRNDDGTPMSEIEARATAAKLQRLYDAGQWDPWAEAKTEAAPSPAEPAPPLTVLAWCREWGKAQTYGSAGEDRQRIELYLQPHALASMPLSSVTPRDVLAFVKHLRALPSARGGTIAPRTVRNSFDPVRRAFAAAVIEGHIKTSPCVLPKGALPALTDKNAEWREGAVFTRDEVHALMFDTRIPEDRRALYAVLLLTGCRIGEAAALRWRHYAAARAPLGALLVARSLERRSREEKGTKTGVTRTVPVHPLLRDALAAWRSAGCASILGRKPEPDDLLVPSRGGGHRGERQVLARLQEDLARLGFRPRRVHDTRRTLISLARAGGARADVLRWVTHGGSRASIIDAYSSLPWETLCAEVLCFRLEAPSQPLPPGGSATGFATTPEGSGETPMITGGGGRIRTRRDGSHESAAVRNRSGIPARSEPLRTAGGGSATGSATAVAALFEGAEGEPTGTAHHAVCDALAQTDASALALLAWLEAPPAMA